MKFLHFYLQVLKKHTFMVDVYSLWKFMLHFYFSFMKTKCKFLVEEYKDILILILIPYVPIIIPIE